MLEIHTILCRAGTMDNYSYLIIDKATGKSAIIDPSETAPIVALCEELNIKPDYIFNTHHHFDHTDSNLDIKERYQAQVVGNINDASRIRGFDIGVKEGDIFLLGESKAEIIDASAHTQGHILWYFPQDKALFTGDTLFNLCIGGLFEGSAEEMYAALEKIKNLPDDINFYPGHEYTRYGAADALKKLPNEPMLKEYLIQAQQKLSKGLPVAPVTLGVEKKCNPYLVASTINELKNLL